MCLRESDIGCPGQELLQRHPRLQPAQRRTEAGMQALAEAKVIALRLGRPPKGYSNWSLRLLAEHVVELGLVESISYETIRQTLKKTG